MRALLFSLLVLSGYASAHEWTPTYPKLRMSHMSGIWVTEMKLFNGREDIEYFDISVFDEDMNKVPSAVIGNPVRVKHETIEFIDVYIRDKDKSRAVYICSKSKLLATDDSKPMLFTRICSKIK